MLLIGKSLTWNRYCRNVSSVLTNIVSLKEVDIGQTLFHHVMWKITKTLWIGIFKDNIQRLHECSILRAPSDGCHCVKSVRIRSYPAPYFPSFGMNTERLSVSLRNQSEFGKIQTRITPNMDTFHAVCIACYHKKCRCIIKFFFPKTLLLINSAFFNYSWWWVFRMDQLDQLLRTLLDRIPNKGKNLH